MFNNKTSKQVEEELQQLFEKYKLTKKLSVKVIKDWIYNSKNTNVMEAVNLYQKKFLAYFKKAYETDGFDEILQICMDAWNYFPHKALDGKSPQQMSEEIYGNEPKNEQDQAMPKIIVGGRQMEWDDYWSMIKEMEHLQAPFKNWLEKDFKPKYKKFLHQKYKKKTIEKHFQVAEFFFDRVLHLGFLELEQIRKNFIQKEFPRWWQTHVLMDSLTEKEVVSSLRKLFEFIELVYDIDKLQFGFS